MSGEFVAPDDPRWRAALRRIPHDAYHLPEYVALEAEREGAKPLAYLAEEEDRTLLVPLLERPLPAGLGGADAHDLASPYGYASPILAGEGAASRGDRLLRGFAAAAAARGSVSAFVRLHPILPFPDAALRAWGAVVDHGPTVAVDLEQADDRRWAGYRDDTRRGIEKLRRRGYRVLADDWSRLDAFTRVYRATMSRVGAEAFYFFDGGYLQAFRERLADGAHLFSAVGPDGDVAAAGLFLEAGGILEFHLSGTADAHLKAAPTKLILHEAARWGRERGARILHLGGGVAAREDSLFAFKAGFSPRRGRYRTWRAVFDEDAYARLTAARGHAAEGGDGRFPAYRAPARQEVAA